MSNLLIFYSRSGNTRKVAQVISENLSCDVEEIKDTKKRLGFIGYLRSVKDVLRKKLPTLKKITKNPEQYDLIIIGTPIWVSNMAAPIRTYITENKDKFKNIAFFCTQGGGKGGKGGEKCLPKMGKLCAKEPVATLIITAKEVKKEIFNDKVLEFSSKLS